MAILSLIYNFSAILIKIFFVVFGTGIDKWILKFIQKSKDSLSCCCFARCQKERRQRKKVALVPTVMKKAVGREVIKSSEKSPENFGIGQDSQPHRDLTCFVK
jgi:hypothetical protein